MHRDVVRLIAAISGAGFTFAVAGSATAATVIYTPSKTISGVTDVDTTGTLDRAYDFAGAGLLTVNGVTFNDFDNNASGDTFTFVDTDGNVGNMYEYAGFGAPASLAGDTTSPTPGSYAALLSHGAYVSPHTATLTFKGLTIGASYEFQTFAEDTRAGTNANVTTETLDPTAILPTGMTNPSTMAVGGTALGPESTTDGGGYGQTIIGTFVADATTQSIVYYLPTDGTGIDLTLANAVQLRDLPATPEPASLSLFAVGGLGLLARRRRSL